MTLRLVDIGDDTLVNPEEVAAVISGHDGLSQRYQVILKSGVRLSAGKELSMTEVVERVTQGLQSYASNHHDPSYFAAAVPGER